MTILLASFLLWASLVTTPAPVTDSIQTELQKAGLAMKDDNIAKAREHYLAALRLDSTNVEALRNLGMLASNQGDNKQALTYLRRARGADPKDAAVANNLGAVYNSLGKSAEAIKEYEAAVRLDSTNAMFLSNLAIEYLNAGRANDALTAVRKSARYDSTHTLVPFLTGNIFRQTKRFDSAQVYYDRAERMGGGAPELYYYRGLTYQYRGMDSSAEKDFRTALKGSPKYKECLKMLGVLYIGQRRYEDAYTTFGKLVKVDTTDMPGLVAYGAVCGLTKRDSLATAIRTKLDAKDPNLSMQMDKLIDNEKARGSAKKK